MRLLLFSDLHANLRAARALVDKAQDVDVVIGAGDFGNLRRNLDNCLQVLSEIDKVAVLVAGNNESTNELATAARVWKSAHILHGNIVHLCGETFFGIGGGIPITPFGDWSYDFSEEDAQQLLQNAPRGGVWVSHSPPKGLVDRSSNGQSLGSSSVLDAIQRLMPRLVVCGHIHASSGKWESMGPTTIVNAGPLGIIWDLPDTS